MHFFLLRIHPFVFEAVETISIHTVLSQAVVWLNRVLHEGCLHRSPWACCMPANCIWCPWVMGWGEPQVFSP